MEEFNWTVENVNYINSLFNEPLLVIVDGKVMLASEDAVNRLREKAIEKRICGMKKLTEISSELTIEDVRANVDYFYNRSMEISKLVNKNRQMAKAEYIDLRKQRDEALKVLEYSSNQQVVKENNVWASYLIYLRNMNFISNTYENLDSNLDEFSQARGRFERFVD